MNNEIKSPEPVTTGDVTVSVLVFVLEQSNCVYDDPSSLVVSEIRGVQRSGVIAVIAVGSPQA